MNKFLFPLVFLLNLNICAQSPDNVWKHKPAVGSVYTFQGFQYCAGYRAIQSINLKSLGYGYSHSITALIHYTHSRKLIGLSVEYGHAIEGMVGGRLKLDFHGNSQGTRFSCTPAISIGYLERIHFSFGYRLYFYDHWASNPDKPVWGLPEVAVAFVIPPNK